MPRKTPDALVDALALGCARGLSVRAAAKRCGLAERTAQRLSKTPEFQQTLTRLREEVVSQAVDALSGAAVAAVRRLVKATRNPDDEVAVKAANSLLDRLVAVREHARLSSKLAELRGIIESRVGD
jgi:hypothetical protein